MPAGLRFPRPSQRAAAIPAISRTAAGTRIFQRLLSETAAGTASGAATDEEDETTVGVEPEDGGGVTEGADCAGCGAAATTPELTGTLVAELAAAVNPLWVSRFSRCRSALISAALWHRRLRSFSRALLIIRSSSAGMSGFSRIAATGALSSIALKMTPELSPRNGNVPVAIS